MFGYDHAFATRIAIVASPPATLGPYVLPRTGTHKPLTALTVILFLVTLIKSAWANHGRRVKTPSELPQQRHSSNTRAERIVYWLHLHKVGGTFMCKMAQLVGEVVSKPLTNCNLPWKESVSLSDIPTEQLQYILERNLSFVANEGPLPNHLPPRTSSVFGTLIRNPLERTYSHFKMHNSQHSFSSKALRAWLHQTPDNWMTRMLCGPPCWRVAHGCLNISHFQTALNRVRQFDVVGVLEDWNKSAELMSAHFGWSFDRISTIIAEERRSIHNRRRTLSMELSTLSNAAVEALVLHNQWDSALYTDVCVAGGHACRRGSSDLIFNRTWPSANISKHRGKSCKSPCCGPCQMFGAWVCHLLQPLMSSSCSDAGHQSSPSASATLGNLTFEQIDTNHDDVITRKEFIAAASKAG